MGCGITDPAGCIGVVIGHLVGGAVGDVASSAWDQVCKSFADAASQLLGAFGKAFVAIPDVDLGSAGIRNVYGISLGLAATVAALLLLGQVISTAFSHDGSALAQALTGVGKAALATLLTLSVAGAGLQAADQLTNFIVTQTFGSVQVLSAKIAAIVSWTGSGATLQAALLLIFAVVGILLTIVLWFETAGISMASGRPTRSAGGWNRWLDAPASREPTPMPSRPATPSAHAGPAATLRPWPRRMPQLPSLAGRSHRRLPSPQHGHPSLQHRPPRNGLDHYLRPRRNTGHRDLADHPQRALPRRGSPCLRMPG